MDFRDPKRFRPGSLFSQAPESDRANHASKDLPPEAAEHHDLRQSPFARRIANAIIVAFFLLLPFVYIFNFHHKFGPSLIGTDQRSSGPPANPANPPRDSSAANSVPPPAVSLPATAALDSPAGGAAPVPAASGARQPASPAASSDALAVLSQPGAPGSNASTPSISDLWAAVQRGDVDSEVALARLYLSGTAGVSKNCEQARVLFKAAAKKGNADAQHELDNLPAQGCP